MLPGKQANKELFNDGELDVYSTSKRVIVQHKAHLRFGLRTIGVTRFYQAKIANSGIDKLISVPLNPFINTNNTLIVMDGVQYTVSQVQEKYDSIPPAMYVTLNKAMPEYSMAERIDDEGD